MSVMEERRMEELKKANEETSSSSRKGQRAATIGKSKSKQNKKTFPKPNLPSHHTYIHFMLSLFTTRDLIVRPHRTIEL